jgi:hypothetical protein
MAIYDPYSPYVLGSQYCPIVSRTETLDTGSAIGFTFTATETTHKYPVWLRLTSRDMPPGELMDQELICKIYRGTDPTEAMPPARKIIVPADDLTPGIDVGYDATLMGGATDVGDALSSTSSKYIKLLAGGYVGVQFAMNWTSIAAELSGNIEILDVTVLYVITGNYLGQTSPVTLGLYDLSKDVNYVMDSNVSGVSAEVLNTAFGRSRFGELNPWWYDGIDPTIDLYRMPWVYEALDDTFASRPGLHSFTPGFSGGDLYVFVQIDGIGEFHVHYMALEITYRPLGDLVGVGGLNLSSGPATVNGSPAATYTVPILSYPRLRTDAAALPYAAWLPELQPGQKYTIMVGRSNSGPDSTARIAPIPITGIDALTNNLPDLVGGRITRPIAELSVPELETRTFAPAIVWHAGSIPAIYVANSPPSGGDIPVPAGEADPFDSDSIDSPNDSTTISPDGHPYFIPVVRQVSATTVTFVTGMVLNDETASCPWIAFYARRQNATSADLTVYQSTDPQVDDPPVAIGPTASISVTNFDLLTDIVGGWRLVTIPISPDVVFDSGGSGAAYWFTFVSSTIDSAPWEIAVASVSKYIGTTGAWNRASYGSNVAYENCDDQVFAGANEFFNNDVTVYLIQEIDSVAGLSVALACQPLTTVSNACLKDNPHVPTGISYVMIDWDVVTTAYGAGFGYYEIQRRDTTMAVGVWETIVKATDQAACLADDYEARVGVTVSYRIRMAHVTGVVGAWSAETSIEIPEPGVSGRCVDTGLLIMTSNEDPTLNLAVVQAGASGEKFTMVEAEWSELTPIYARDFQVATWQTERGGCAFSRTVVVNTIGTPLPASLDRAFTALRNMTWSALPYVCVRDELGNRWLANVSLPTVTIRRHREGHYQLADITITEVTEVPHPADVEVTS